MKQKAFLAVSAALLFAGLCVIENGVVRARPTQESQQPVSSVYMLAGEFRTVFANLLWFKVDNYHHEFIAHDSDWRRNKDLISLLDLIVMLDPKFEQAWATAACIYANGYVDNEKALKYLRQGITNNPKSRELYELTAIMYANRLHDPQRGLPYARLAVKYAEDEWYLRRAARLERTVREMANSQAGQAPPIID